MCTTGISKHQSPKEQAMGIALLYERWLGVEMFAKLKQLWMAYLLYVRFTG